MKIAIDIDDTLSEVDRLKYTEPYLRENGLKFNLVNPDAHVLKELYDWSEEDVFRYVKNGGLRPFTEAPVRKGAKETVRKWKEAGHGIIILTARSTGWFGDAALVSRKWLDGNGIVYDEIVADVWEKGEYCLKNGIGILIDDNFEICKKAQELGVKSVMLVGRHNLAHAKEITYAGPSWAHIASAVEFILNPPRPRD